MEHSINFAAACRIVSSQSKCRYSNTIVGYFNILFRAQMQYSRYNYTILITHTQEPSSNGQITKCAISRRAHRIALIEALRPDIIICFFILHGYIILLYLEPFSLGKYWQGAEVLAVHHSMPRAISLNKYPAPYLCSMGSQCGHRYKSKSQCLRTKALLSSGQRAYCYAFVSSASEKKKTTIQKKIRNGSFFCH